MSASVANTTILSEKFGLCREGHGSVKNHLWIRSLEANKLRMRVNPVSVATVHRNGRM
jgi:hypothetical protein